MGRVVAGAIQVGSRDQRIANGSTGQLVHLDAGRVAVGHALGGPRTVSVEDARIRHQEARLGIGRRREADGEPRRDVLTEERVVDHEIVDGAHAQPLPILPERAAANGDASAVGGRADGGGVAEGDGAGARGAADINFDLHLALIGEARVAGEVEGVAGGEQRDRMGQAVGSCGVVLCSVVFRRVRCSSPRRAALKSFIALNEEFFATFLLVAPLTLTPEGEFYAEAYFGRGSGFDGGWSAGGDSRYRRRPVARSLGREPGWH